MAMSKGEERRLRRSEERRGAILAAAAEVFAAKGYHTATTREIAEAADLAEGTIFNYFPSKRDLLVAIFEQGAERMRRLAQSRLDPALPMHQALASLLEATLAFYSEHRLLIRTIVAEAWTDPELLRTYALPRLQRLGANLQGYLEAQIAAGRMRPFDTALGVRLVLGMMAALILPIVHGVQPPPGPEERHRLANRVVELLLNGVSTRGEN